MRLTGSFLPYTGPMPKCASRRRLRLAVIAASLTMLCTGAHAVTDPTAGPERGETVPAFSAVDQAGNPQDFGSLKGEQGLLLLFFRSADW